MNILILVVEDEQSLAELLETFLIDLGYNVITANNGQTALNVLDKTRVELIISDVMMPVVDGYELVHEIRTTPDLSETPILLISAAPINRGKLMPFHAEAYLSKPYELDRLETLVQQLTEFSVG